MILHSEFLYAVSRSVYGSALFDLGQWDCIWSIKKLTNQQGREILLLALFVSLISVSLCYLASLSDNMMRIFLVHATEKLIIVDRHLRSIRRRMDGA